MVVGFKFSIDVKKKKKPSRLYFIINYYMFHTTLFTSMLLVKEHALKNTSIWTTSLISFNELWILSLPRNCYYCTAVVLGEISVKIIIHYLLTSLPYFCMVMQNFSSKGIRREVSIEVYIVM